MSSLRPLTALHTRVKRKRRLKEKITRRLIPIKRRPARFSHNKHDEIGHRNYPASNVKLLIPMPKESSSLDPETPKSELKVSSKLKAQSKQRQNSSTQAKTNSWYSYHNFASNRKWKNR